MYANERNITSGQSRWEIYLHISKRLIRSLYARDIHSQKDLEHDILVNMERVDYEHQYKATDAQLFSAGRHAIESRAREYKKHYGDPSFEIRNDEVIENKQARIILRIDTQDTEDGDDADIPMDYETIDSEMTFYEILRDGDGTHIDNEIDAGIELEALRKTMNEKTWKRLLKVAQKRIEGYPLLVEERNFLAYWTRKLRTKGVRNETGERNPPAR